MHSQKYPILSDQIILKLQFNIKFIRKLQILGGQVSQNIDLILELSQNLQFKSLPLHTVMLEL